MNVIPSASGRRSKTTTTPSKGKLQDYEEKLNFYTESPVVELSIDDFEVFALKRLKVGAMKMIGGRCHVIFFDVVSYCSRLTLDSLFASPVLLLLFLTVKGSQKD